MISFILCIKYCKLIAPQIHHIGPCVHKNILTPSSKQHCRLPMRLSSDWLFITLTTLSPHCSLKVCCHSFLYHCSLFYFHCTNQLSLSMRRETSPTTLQVKCPTDPPVRVSLEQANMLDEVTPKHACNFHESTSLEWGFKPASH